MDEIILIGAGGHASSCIDVIEKTKNYKIAGFIEKNVTNVNSFNGYPILGSDKDLSSLRKKYTKVHISIGQIKNYKSRLKIFEIVKDLNFELPVIVSPKSYVSQKSSLGPGTIVMHNVVVNANVTIGNNCIINSKALIEHDSIIEDHCHISTGSIINGNCIVGDNTFIGSGSIIVNGQKIPPRSFIKAGTRYYNKENRE